MGNHLEMDEKSQITLISNLPNIYHKDLLNLQEQWQSWLKNSRWFLGHTIRQDRWTNLHHLVTSNTGYEEHL